MTGRGSDPAESSSPLYYVDTSAALRLLLEEEHSADLYAVFEGTRDSVAWVSSEILRVEVMRTVRRVAPVMLLEALEMLEHLGFVHLAADVVDAAVREPDPVLRSLDALHVATARLLGDQVQGFVTYDQRQAAAATAAGLPVLTPGRPGP
ncbi:MAG: type II toxin-antitoxin system VapC family toxin [Kineosporiaceae bacterium]